MVTAATSNIIFRDGLFRLAVPMAAGGLTSEHICADELSDPNLKQGYQERGSMTPNAIIFPSNWVTSDVYFEGYLDDTFTNAFQIMTGGVTNSLFVISGCGPNTQVPLPLDIFSSIKFFVIKSIVPQAAGAAPVIVFFPLEQLSA